MAKAYGYIIVYNNNGDIVYQHKGSGGDYGGTVSLNNNIVTISSDYAPQVEPIDDSDPEFPDAFPTVIDTGEVNVSNLTNPTSLQIVLPYKASKNRYFSGNSGNFADSAGSDYADVIINNGETITLASNNYSSGGGCAIQYYEPQPTLTFKHFYDAGTIGTGAVKFRHYSQTEPVSQLAIPQNVTADGTTVSWDEVENATSYAVLADGSEIGTVEKAPAVVMPVKGDIITLDSKQYRVLKTEGTVAEVLAMYDANSSIKFDSQSSNYNNTYAGKNIDTYCNNTFYSGLSAAMKNAIVDKTFTQDSWKWTSSAPTESHYTGKSVSSTYYLTLVNAAYGSSITRHCYCLSVQDVLDYLEATTSMGISDTTLTYTNIWKMFWNVTTSQSDKYIWLRSAASSGSNYVFRINGRHGSLGDSNVSSTNAARPAFQIDLSKISWSK